MPTTPTPPTKPRDIIKRRSAEFFPEIQRRFGRKSFKPKHLGDGGAGVVYRVSPTKVVKVMLGRTKYAKVKHYKRMFKQLTHQTQPARQHPYEQFYIHSTFHTSREADVTGKTRVPHFVYELMEYMPSDLKGFAKRNAWTGAEFKAILCQVMHGLHLFHRIGYVITDLKVDNVLIDPVTGQIKLNDFCESFNTRVRSSSCMYTYRNFANRHTPQEDVWRLALLVLEFLHPRVLHLARRHRLELPPKDFIRSIRGRLKAKQHYDYASMAAPCIAFQKRVMMAHDPDTALWRQLYPMLVRMLDNDPQKRPSLHAVLTSRVFCEACFAPRTQYKYKEAFGSRYETDSESHPSPLASGSTPTHTHTNGTGTHHTPLTAGTESSRASLSIPSTVATRGTTTTSSTRGTTTSDYGRHRRKRHAAATTSGSHSLRPWTVSGTGHTGTASSKRKRARRRNKTKRWHTT